jgi:hypothetical protein
MNDNLIHQKVKPADEPIVIADECGDSMWDAVLNQEVKLCDVKEISINTFLLLNNIKQHKSPPKAEQ